MRFVRYDRNGALRLGALDGDSVVDLLDASVNGTPSKILAAFSDMTRLIEGAGHRAYRVVAAA